MKEYLLNVTNALGGILSRQKMDPQLAAALEGSLRRIVEAINQLGDEVTNADAADILDQLGTLFEQMSKGLSSLAEDNLVTADVLEDVAQSIAQ